MARTTKPTVRGRIDWEFVRLSLGTALLCGGGGALLLYATLTAAPGSARGAASRAMSVSYGLARMLPDSVSSRLAAGLGVLMVLFAAVLVVAGVATIFKRR